MKPELLPVYEKSIEQFHADARVLAAYMTGSVGTDREDQYSDVDPMLLVRSDDFEAFDRDLPGIFAALGVTPVLWWPERCNCETLRNYAVMFEREGVLLQYDITFGALPEGGRVPVRPDQVIFDKAGVLEVAEGASHAGYSPDRLRWTIEMYWLYIYIHAKYLKRGDRFKLIAAQHELLNCHLEVLRALRPETPFDWWPITARRLSESEPEWTFMSYLAHLDAASVSEALPTQMARFSSDARAACQRWDVEYPDDFEGRATHYVEAAFVPGGPGTQA